MADTDLPVSDVSSEARDMSIMDGGETDKVIDLNEPEKEPIEKEEKKKEDVTDEDIEQPPSEVEDEGDEDVKKETKRLLTDEEEEEEQALTELDGKVSRPSFREIQKKYPNVFSDFPELRDIYHRDALVFGASGLFTTVEEAKEAGAKANNLDEINQAITQGNFEGVLRTLDEKSIIDFAGSVPKALHDINPKLYFELSAPILADVMNAAWRKAEQTGSQAMKNSVLNLCQFLYNKQELPKLNNKPTDPRLEEDRKQLEAEKSKVVSERNFNFQNSTNKIIEKRLNEIILDGLDPTNELPDFTKKSIQREVTERIGQLVAKNANLKNDIRALFARAEKRGWPTEIKSQIISRYLGAVKPQIAALKSQIKAEALGRRTRPTGPKSLQPRRPSENRTRTVGASQIDPRKVNWRQSSDDDILNGKVTLK